MCVKHIVSVKATTPDQAVLTAAYQIQQTMDCYSSSINVFTTEPLVMRIYYKERPNLSEYFLQVMIVSTKSKLELGCLIHA
jgi:hypothetical protein